MLAEILTRAGYRTGRYISPHLIRMNERFCVDGEPISDEVLTETAAVVRKAADQMIEKPNNFELLTALSFVFFLQCSCDIVVLEVGLGGRLDATNVIDHSLVSLIMHIGLEHTAELGDTIEQIAYEKAGIIKQGGDVVLYQQSREVEDVVSGICKEREANLYVTDRSALEVTDRGILEQDGRQAFGLQHFTYRDRRDLSLSLLGSYQTRNAAVVLDAVDLLVRKHGFVISDETIRESLSLVRWPGRFQVLRQDPVLVVDGAHNPNGVQALAESVRLYFSSRQLILLMGVMADKNYRRMLDLLAEECGDMKIVSWIAQAPAEDRALNPERLKEEIRKRFDCPVQACGSVQDGLRLAIDLADKQQEQPVILAFGSLYQVGEILAIVEEEKI